MADIYHSRHLESLTGLRFLAALAVFVSHVPSFWPLYDQHNLPIGGAGVSFFYVLSGFILTYVYGARIAGKTQSGDTEKFSYLNFYLRRFARIWPLHFATLLIFVIAVMGFSLFFAQENGLAKFLVNTALLQSWIPNFDWSTSGNGLAWSLSVEVFFYFMFPFLLLGNTRSFVWKFVGVFVAAFLILYGVHVWVPLDHPWIPINAVPKTFPAVRLPEFVVGIAIGKFYMHRATSADGRTRIKNANRFLADSMLEFLSFVLLFGFFAWSAFLGLYAAEPKHGIAAPFWFFYRFSGAAPVFAIVIFIFASTRGAVSKFVGSAPMVFLGEISFAFYMIHMPVIFIMVRMDWAGKDQIQVLLAVSSFIFSIIFSALLFKFVEMPFRRIIVAAFEKGKFKSTVVDESKIAIGWLGSKTAILMISTLIGLSCLLSTYRFDAEDASEIARIVAATPTEIKDARFDTDAVLLGCQTTIKQDGTMLLELVWDLKSDRRKNRFIKLVDTNGEVFGRGSANRKLFAEYAGDAVVIDRVVIPAEQIFHTSTIGIGFYQEHRGMAKIDRGPRSVYDQQLDVWKSPKKNAD